MTTDDLQALYAGCFEETGDLIGTVSQWQSAISKEWPRIYRQFKAAKKMYVDLLGSSGPIPQSVREWEEANG